MYQTGVYIVVSSSKLLLFHSPRTALIYSLKKLCFSYFALVHPLSEKKAALALSPLHAKLICCPLQTKDLNS